ncbi:MAG: excinuclease ABC subunit UvrA [Betaproteobacteria bacterium]
METITVKGARTHNLKNVDLVIPKNKLVVITGLSGSGKSSLAFDTLFAEGQRRYIESLSTYARQFLSVLEKPDVDFIEGLSPAIAIEQKGRNQNPRSTVGTSTEIHDHLRLLFARTGEQRCPRHGTPLRAYAVSEMVEFIFSLGLNERILILSEIPLSNNQQLNELLDRLKAQGFFRIRIKGTIFDLDDNPIIEFDDIKSIEVVVDRLKITAPSKNRIVESIEAALKINSSGIHINELKEDKNHFLSNLKVCPRCDYTAPDLDPKMFSFNHPSGACSACEGLGEIEAFDEGKIIAHPSLSLASGAISGWSRLNPFYYDLLTSLSAHFAFDLDTPYEELPEEIKKVILHGSGQQKVEFRYRARNGGSKQEVHAFEGVITNFARRYQESNEPAVKDSLSKFISTLACPNCNRSRLSEASRNVFVEGKSMAEINNCSISEVAEFFEHLSPKGKNEVVSSKIVQEIRKRVSFLIEVGLGYLSLGRQSTTLSGGEAQRIRLASQIGSGLSGVMYVLDEPSIGLHQKDNQRLIHSLKKLRDLGNTVIVVEHDEETILNADFIVDLGPGAGDSGGRIVASGPLKKIVSTNSSITGPYLSGAKTIFRGVQKTVTSKTPKIELIGAIGNNLNNITIEVPVGVITCITGVSGSGKSTLINETFVPALKNSLNSKLNRPKNYEEIISAGKIKYLVNIDQTPIGKTPRSNPATYTGLFNLIREVFSQTPLSRERGYAAGRFSFNIKGGRCEDCQGEGSIRVDLNFLPDVYVPCDTCKGLRYNNETLDIHYRGKNIAEVLDMSISEAQAFFSAIPAMATKLTTLSDVGLGYVKLGQSASSLSGGEAQRVKLAAELAKRNTGNTMYVLDEPTTGLHFEDISWLLKILVKLRDQGNSLVIIEHNLDVISRADWIIELGPGGGKYGGNVTAVGTPREISQTNSVTGGFLRSVLLDQT